MSISTAAWNAYIKASEKYEKDNHAARIEACCGETSIIENTDDYDCTICDVYGCLGRDKDFKNAPCQEGCTMCSTNCDERLHPCIQEEDAIILNTVQDIDLKKETHEKS